MESDPDASGRLNLSDLAGMTGEFRDRAAEAEFCAGTIRSARAMAFLCVLAETVASLAFVPLDVLMLPAPRLADIVQSDRQRLEVHKQRGVTIGVTVVGSQGDVRLLFEVSDTGIGIAPEQEAHRN